MTRYRGATCKLSRREKFDLSLKQDNRDISTKCKFEVSPGQHGSKFSSRITPYCEQFRMKQRVKRVYGILEKQFRRYYENSVRTKGDIGYNIMLGLEMRLDNMLYRLGFASTRQEARQIITHGFARINDKKVDIPSYRISIGDRISISEKARGHVRILESIERSKEKEMYSWILANYDEFFGVLLRYPEMEEISAGGGISIDMVLELYSK